MYIKNLYKNKMFKRIYKTSNERGKFHLINNRWWLITIGATQKRFYKKVVSAFNHLAEEFSRGKLNPHNNLMNNTP